VAQVEFAPDATRDALVARGGVAQLLALAAQWQRFEPFLAIARSPAPRIGLRYANVLLDTKDAANAAKGLALFSRIETDAWNPDDKAAARQGRLRGLIATGKTEEAVTEARELLKTATAPDVQIEARYILARAAEESLRKLVDENPRWEEDDRVRPERHRLYHEAVDFYLYPLLFHGARVEASARGLWHVSELYRFTGEQQLALETARDAASLYPETEPAKLATAWLAKLSAEEKAVDFEKEASGRPRSSSRISARSASRRRPQCPRPRRRNPRPNRRPRTRRCSISSKPAGRSCGRCCFVPSARPRWRSIVSSRSAAKKCCRRAR
jgi:hypothetical protein